MSMFFLVMISRPYLLLGGLILFGGAAVGIGVTQFGTGSGSGDESPDLEIVLSETNLLANLVTKTMCVCVFLVLIFFYCFVGMHEYMCHRFRWSV